MAGLLFCSGACALIYQTVWMRQFRLIFGASTAATAAVLAIFMGGLGLGSAILGRRADVHPQPLRFYAHLELMIAGAAAASPLLLWMAARIYFGIGGSVTLGLFPATLLRLLLATIVLGVATLLMGGTLPAAARAVETSDDEGRRGVALLYGANTLGAVVGTLASTFFMLEVLGNRRTLFVGVLVNALVGIVARSVKVDERNVGPRPSAAAEGSGATGSILLAAAIVGFAFLLMELVWYRMLAPLLGGSTFTFGLILAIALLGIGSGGAAYALWSRDRRATAGGFALTCALEAGAISFPFALGDRLAVYEMFLRSLGNLGFGGFVLGWTALTLVVVFPVAFIAGIQFPLLLSLLGRGEEDVGSQVGAAYAWNTAGAIAGSLAGGFGLLPLLSAPSAWRLVVVLLALLSLAAAFFAARASQIVAAVTALAAIAGTFALGPTAVWRHSGIGAGRAGTPESVNGAREWVYGVRRTLVWDVDGRESSVALTDTNDFAFIVNGKADGSARGDAGTQVMAGLVPAILHPNPRRSLVIGLGTGSTAGWLGAIPSMERVDVVELEPAVLRVARACSAVNHDVLHNPKVRIRIGDAREVLLASRERYDVIFSEPSNPYRAGIASLFTREFYRATTARLQPGGILAQWVQTYDVDSQTIRTIYATIGGVFPHVETWTTDTGDLLLVATHEPIRYDFDELRRRVRREPFRSALTHAWRVETLEGFIAHFLARDTLATAVQQTEHDLNTDDRTLIEFGFARGLGAQERFSMDELTALARTRGEDLPAGIGAIDWKAVAANRASLTWVNALVANASDEDRVRHSVALAYDKLPSVLSEWRAHSFPPMNSQELVIIAEALADGGSVAAEAYAEQLRPWEAVEADAVLARLRWKQARPAEAAQLLVRVFHGCRTDPWPTDELLGHSLDMAGELAKVQALALPLYDALEQPFAAGQWEDARKLYRLIIANHIDGCGPRTIKALRAVEPWPVWREWNLKVRRDCYQSTMDPLARRAQSDYDAFIDAEPMPFNRELNPAPSGSSSSHR